MKMYCYKKFSTCKKAAAFLRERGSSFEEIDYTEQPLSTEQLRAYWQTSGLPLEKFFNTSGILYREMGIKERLLKMTEDEQLELLSQYPMLVKRPILVMKGAALVGFDETRWIEQLNKEDGL